MNDNDGIINEVGQQPDESRTTPNLQQMTSDLETKLNKLALCGVVSVSVLPFCFS